MYLLILAKAKQRTRKKERQRKGVIKMNKSVSSGETTYVLLWHECVCVRACVLRAVCTHSYRHILHAPLTYKDTHTQIYTEYISSIMHMWKFCELNVIVNRVSSAYRVWDRDREEMRMATTETKQYIPWTRSLLLFRSHTDDSIVF